ncbi:MAG TPA: TIGR03013 family XrtA/PEP-CTERM system glycosyltransferase [Nevskiaceae bacterium]
MLFFLQKRVFWWHALLAFVDFVLLVACVYLAVLVRFDGRLGATAGFSGALAWRAPVVGAVLVLAIAAMGLYQVRLRMSWRGRTVRQLVAFFVGWIVLSAAYYLAPDLYLGRGVLGIALPLGFIAIAAWRAVFLAAVDTDLFKRRVLVLGAGQRASEIAYKMRRRTDQRGFKILGYVPIGSDPVVVPESSLVSPGEPLSRWAPRHQVDEIVVGPDDRRGTVDLEDLLGCRRRGIAVTEIADFFEREAGNIIMDLTNPSWLVFSQGFSTSRGHLFVKRLFDVAVASLVALLTWPFMLLVALAIRLESGKGSPILYKQVRVGENGRQFELLKFRSMRVDAERDGVARWASVHDARVTRVGRAIRKTRLDELPQLWNVLRGDMSIVGPRPERPQFVAEFSERIRYYQLRHCVKPGLTGWAQLRYPYGSSQRDAEEKLKFDLFYVKNKNIIFDLAILVQTAEVVVFGRGAR